MKIFTRFSCSSRTSALGLVCLGLAAFLISGSSLHAATLTVSQDSYIDGREGFLSSNFGTSTSLIAGQSGTSNGGRKIYTQFDATGLPEIVGIEDFGITRGGGTINRTILLFAILGENVNDWTETGITWNNAPGNNVDAGVRNFAAFPGETLIQIGSISTGADPSTVYSVTFSGLSEPDTQSILDALNTGSRKLTLGLHYNSSQESAITFLSKESGNGSAAATLNVTFVPEPGTFSLLFGGMALLVASRRRF
jgi:hypothetical protein